MVSTALSRPPAKKTQLSCNTIWSQFCWCLPANFVQVTCTSPSPDVFFLETPVGWSPQTWGLFVKHTKTGGDHGSIDEHSNLSYPQVISYQKDPKGSFIKISVAFERDEGEFFIIFRRFALDGTSWFSYSFLTHGTRFLFPQQLGVRQSIGGFSGRASASKSQNLCASFAVSGFCCFSFFFNKSWFPHLCFQLFTPYLGKMVWFDSFGMRVDLLTKLQDINCLGRPIRVKISGSSR